MPQVKRLLSGFTRWRVGPRGYFAAAFLFLGPLAIAMIYIALGNPPAGLGPGWTIPLLLAQVFTQFFAGPASEEAGWRGFALPRLEAKYNALLSSLILGVIWTFWHLPLFYLTGATQMTIPMPLYLVLTLTLTTYMTWLYNNTRGSLIITTLGHYSYNLTGTLLTGPLSLMPAMVFYLTAGPLLFLIVAGIVITFRPKNLSRKPASALTLPANCIAVRPLRDISSAGRVWLERTTTLTSVQLHPLILKHLRTFMQTLISDFTEINQSYRLGRKTWHKNRSSSSARACRAYAPASTAR